MDALLNPILLVTLAVGWICIEAVFFYIVYRRRSSPHWARWSVANAAAGLMLLLSLLAALAEAGSLVFVICLSGGLIAHLTEVALRPHRQKS